MPNLAAALKEEIRRLARKEIKAEITTTRRMTAKQRREIAALKRTIRAQQRKIAALESREGQSGEESESADGVPEGARFSARSVKAQRRRLKLSAEDFGKLLGVSAQTVYHWEQGKARPRRAQFAALVAARSLGRREALKRLEELGD